MYWDGVQNSASSPKIGAREKIKLNLVLRAPKRGLGCKKDLVSTEDILLSERAVLSPKDTLAHLSRNLMQFLRWERCAVVFAMLSVTCFQTNPSLLFYVKKKVRFSGIGFPVFKNGLRRWLCQSISKAGSSRKREARKTIFTAWGQDYSTPHDDAQNDDYKFVGEPEVW